MSVLSPSRLAIESAGMKPIGSQPAINAGRCAMCGHAFDIGAPVVPFEPTDSFTDYSALRAPTSEWIDGWCAAVWTKEFTQDHSKSVICAEGIFPAASNNDIAWHLMNPPGDRWIFVQSDQKRQHLVWRAPVNVSRDVFSIQYGDLRLTVRRERLLQGRDAAIRLAAVASEGRKGAALKSPFVRLARELDDPLHGVVRPDLYKIANERPEVRADIDILASLSPGETWGLTAVLYVAAPTKPERKALST